MKQAPTRWEATNVAGLYVRQPGGGFYARVTINGKRSWRSLDAKLGPKATRDKAGKWRATPEAKQAHALLVTGRTKQVATRTDDKMHAALDRTVEIRKVRRGIDRPLTAATITYHAEILAAAKRLFLDRPLGSFDDTAILSALQNSGLGQSRRKAVFELLKSTFKRAKEGGAINTNPLADHIPGQVKKKDRELPTREQLDNLIETVGELFPRYGHRAALSIRFLAFTGFRLKEALSITWVDVGDDKITLRPGEGIKTGGRTLDINPPLRAVLEDIAGMYGTEGRVMPQKSVRKQLRAACAKMKLQPLDHHDLRAWFITWNILSGTDVGTLSEWVGNSPKVLLERYLSVQDEQRKAAASKLQ